MPRPPGARSPAAPAPRRLIDRRPGVALQLTVLAVLLVGCPGNGNRDPATAIPPRFENATAARGLSRATQTFSSAFVDLDTDGDDDLVVSNHGRDVALYVNAGGRFVDRSELLPSSHNDRHGLTIFDFDADGDPDIALATGGGGRDFEVGPGSDSQIFENRVETGQLAFQDVSSSAGFGFREWRGRWFLPVPTPTGIDLLFRCLRRTGRPDLYLRNTGSLRFAVVDHPTLSRESSSEGKDTLWDYDRDGITDLLTIDDTQTRVLRGTVGGFREMGVPGLAGNRFTAVAVGDLDRDLFPDLYLGGREGAGDRVLINAGDGRFRLRQRLPHQQWTRSVAVVDLDLDGWPDVVVQRGNASGEPNGDRLALMNSGGRFQPHPISGRPTGQADDVVVGFVDADALPDLFLTNGWGLPPTNAGPYELLLNRTPTPFDAVLVRLEGRPPNTGALGAQVELLDADRRPVGYRMLAPRGQAQDTDTIHFGLGSATGPFLLRVVWPDGSTQESTGVEGGSLLTISQQ